MILKILCLKLIHGDIRIYKIHIRFKNMGDIFNIIKYALVIARFRVQYGQHCRSFSYFADLFHEPLSE